jgi:hypothetical protein
MGSIEEHLSRERARALAEEVSARTARLEISARALSVLILTFKRWLYLPDAAALLAVLGTVAANRMGGDPLWLLLIGPPGGGKTELLQPGLCTQSAFRALARSADAGRG